MFAHEGVFPPLQRRWPDWCMQCGRRWCLSSTTCTVASINMMGCSPCSCTNAGKTLPWAQCQQHRKPRHKPILAKKGPHAPVQQELTQHTTVARMCDVISANKLVFKGTGSSFSEKCHGIQSSHTKAFFLPYKDVGLSGACRVAGGGA